MGLASFQKTAKTIGLIVFMLLVLGGVIFLGRGASTYLAKASSCQAQKVSATNVSENSAVITWQSEDISQGRVEYGTNASNLTFSAPEATSGKDHNVRLTLLTPNTVYYYLVTIGTNKCDSSGQVCTTSCVPWSFTTATAAQQERVQQPIASPTVSSVSATPSASVTAGAISPTKAATPTLEANVTQAQELSSFCLEVKANVGANSSDTTVWEKAKKYDIDSNSVINGLDVVKCQQQGK